VWSVEKLDGRAVGFAQARCGGFLFAEVASAGGITGAASVGSRFTKVGHCRQRVGE
jgi:hypothetical protein